MKKFVLLILTTLSGTVIFSQVRFDSFTDGNFTSNPAWGGNTSNWTVVANSDVSFGAPGSQSLRLNAPAISGTDYLSSQVSTWGAAQEWGFFMGRRNQESNSANQSFFWLYANEANVNSSTVDGYRIAFGGDLANDYIRLEYIVDGAVSATVITSSGGTPSGITDFGFLVRVRRNPTGQWQLFTTALPQISHSGATALSTPDYHNAIVSQGTATNNVLVPASNGYIGVSALHTADANAIVAQEFDQVYFTAYPVDFSVIHANPDIIGGFISVINVPSAVQSYVVSADNLMGNLNLASVPQSFDISLSNNPFVPVNSLQLIPVAGSVPPTTIYTRMNSIWYSQPYTPYLDEIMQTSTGAADKPVTVYGFVLAPEPTVESTLSFGASTANSIVVNVAGGNGEYQTLVAKEGAPVDFIPQDASTYSAGPYGTAPVGNGNYVVAQGQLNISPTTVTGLAPGKVYYFAVFNYTMGLTQGGPPMEVNGSENYLLPGGTGAAATSLGNPLPITINYFKGVKQTNKNLLTWKVTCISTPRATMILERSADSRNFTGINSITADALRCDQPFDFTDTDPLKGMNYYRLKMIDADGKVTYSSLVALLNAAKGFDITGIAPNPVASDHFNLNIASAQAGKIEVGIVDMQGRLVKKESISLIAGFTSLPVMVSGLANGTYTLRCTMDGGETKELRFVKTGK